MTNTPSEEADKCYMCNDEVCTTCHGHMCYGIDCLEATMNPEVDYCECDEAIKQSLEQPHAQ